MDTVTQLCLGAAFGEAVVGRQAGRRGLFFGAAVSQIPDLDVLLGLPLSDFDQLWFHRSWSHSLLFCVLLSPLLGRWLAALNEGKAGDTSRADWTVMSFLVLGSHIALDCCTTFGTRVLWPFSDYALAFSIISVIDPLFTVPLLIAVGLLIWAPRRPPIRERIVNGALLWCLLYLVAAVGIKGQMQRALDPALSQERGFDLHLELKPTFGNIILWRGIAKSGDGYWQTWRSLFDEGPPEFRYVPRNHMVFEALNGMDDAREIVEMTRGFYQAHPDPMNNAIHLHDLRWARMGGFATQELDYPFTYQLKIIPHETGFQDLEISRIPPTLDPAERKLLLRLFWERLRGRKRPI